MSDAIKNRKIDKNRGNIQLTYNEHTKKFQFSSYGIVHEFDLKRNVDNNKGGFNINSNWNNLDYLNLNVLGTSEFMKVSTNGGYNCFDLLDEINSHVFLLQQSKSKLDSPFSAEIPGATRSGLSIDHGAKKIKGIALTSKYHYVGDEEGLANYCNNLRRTYKC